MDLLATYKRAITWIDGNWPRVYDNIPSKRSFETVRKVFASFPEEPWPGEASPPFEISIPGQSEDSLVVVLSNARAYLMAAAESLNERPITIRKLRGKKQYRLCWEDELEAEKTDKGGYRSIYVVGKLWRTEFSTDFMLGAHAMAASLGVTLVDARQDRRTFEDDGVYVKQLVRQLDPSNDTLLFYFESPARTVELIDHLETKGFRPVRTGFNDGSLSINNRALARQLMTRAIEDERSIKKKKGRKKFLILTFERTGDLHALDIRYRIYREVATEGENGDLVEIDKLPVDVYAYDDDVEERVDQALERTLAQTSPESISAIFTRTEFSTIATLDGLKKRGIIHIRCYSEALVNRVLRRLAMGDNSLAAVCGGNFYHLGRYAVRAACSRQRGGFPQAPPILLARSEAKDERIFSIDRIPVPHNGMDMRLDSSPYAWFDWMKALCGQEFGPGRVKPTSP